ncbi:choline/ethanolamine kinase family protein [Aestuariispira ectoiniformans]|uniref:choline/ethanolamine kinase family protein n=1 Tax=Aestuariispira ectoiniformans TaxID=2775080 RepID=UPI00223AF857|nr:choline/ethanolamine kinase family protein [Aestuariispira ectoiniformans]
MTDNYQFVSTLPFWTGPIDPKPLDGGITNVNFVVEDAGQKFVVRVGGDIPLHQVMRFNERAASEAAFEAGISPEVVYATEGALVLRFIEGKTYDAVDIRRQQTLEKILPVIRKCHRDMPKYLKGPALIFWVFHVLRNYASTIVEGQGRRAADVPQLMEMAEKLEKAVGAIDLVYGHNDLLPANFLDDGDRLWLIDWDYGGFNSPLFDLGGLASNAGLSPGQEEWLLEAYFDKPVTDDLRHRYAAMKCASLLRETMWSMVSELHSEIDFDYATYTDTNLKNYESAVSAFLDM